MMSGVPLETCWAFTKLWNNKFYYNLHLVGIATESYNDARIHEYKKEGYNVCVRHTSVCGNKNIQSRVCCYRVHSEKFQNCAQCLRHFLPQSSLCSSSCCCHTSKWHVLLLLDNIRLAKLLFPNHIATNYNLIYSYNKSQRNALFLKFILVQISTCLGQIYCPSSGVLTSLVDSQHNQYNKYLLLCIQY